MSEHDFADAIPQHLRKPRLSRREAPEYLLIAYGIKIAVSTLAKMASVGGGPGYNKFGVTPLYPREELDAWALERLGRVVRSSSEGRA